MFLIGLTWIFFSHDFHLPSNLVSSILEISVCVVVYLLFCVKVSRVRHFAASMYMVKVSKNGFLISYFLTCRFIVITYGFIFLSLCDEETICLSWALEGRASPMSGRLRSEASLSLSSERISEGEGLCLRGDRLSALDFLVYYFSVDCSCFQKC